MRGRARQAGATRDGLARVPGVSRAVFTPSRGMPGLGREGARATVVLLTLSSAVAGCAARDYAGISLVDGAADRTVQALARRALGGDRAAQLELGLRFEQGRGVERDPARACAIYNERPSRASGDILVWQPSTRSVERYSRQAAEPAESDELAFKAYQCRAAPRRGSAG